MKRGVVSGGAYFMLDSWKSYQAYLHREEHRKQPIGGPCLQKMGQKISTEKYIQETLTII